MMPKPTSDRRATERKHPWPMVRLGDVCELKNGYTPSANMLSEKEGIPYFRVSAMSFSGNEKLLKVPNAYCADQGKRVFPAGAVVFPKNGGAAQTHKVRVLVNESIVDLNTGLAIPRECICSEYLYYWFEDLPINDCIIVGAIPFVDFGMLGNRKILLPPLSEQKEIVARLERELAAVEKMKKGFASLAETAKAEFKAELKEVFEEIKHRGTETRRLGDVCDTISTRGHQIKQSEIGDCGKFPVVSQSENDIEGWTNEDIAIDTVPLVLFGDHTCVVKKIDEPFVVGADGAKLLRSSECDNSFLFYFIKETAVSLLDGEYRRHYSDLANAEIPIPPLSTQREMVVRLDLAKARAEKLEAKAREGVAVCETMRKAILKEAFEGID